MDYKIVGKWALVTGSSRGTGAAIARALAEEGATVLVHDAQGISPREVVDSIVERGGRAFGVEGDIKTNAGANAVLEQARRHTGVIDILINNFGQAAGGKWWTTEDADWLDAYETNTLSSVRMIQRFAPAMREQGWGRVVQLATVGVFHPNSRMPHYYAAKAALANLGLSLARELSGSGVTVNTVSPGFIRTPEVEQYFLHLAEKHGWGKDWNEVERRGVEKLMPNFVGRMARVEEIAQAVAFLSSEGAAFINGVNLRVDGGALGSSVG